MILAYVLNLQITLYRVLVQNLVWVWCVIGTLRFEARALLLLYQDYNNSNSYSDY